MVKDHLTVSSKNHATKSVFTRFIRMVLLVQHHVRDHYRHQGLQMKLLERSFDKESRIMLKFL